jgi:hypothetical protein
MPEFFTKGSDRIVEEKVEMGLVNSKVTNINVEKAIDSTIDVPQAGDSFTDSGKMEATLDKPAIGNTPMSVLMKDGPHFNNVSGLETFSPLHLQAGDVSRPTPTDIGVKVEDTSLISIGQNMSFIEAFAWTIDDPVGTLVFPRGEHMYHQITPMTKIIKLGTGARSYPSLQEVLSLDYSFWQGSIVYGIEVVCSPGHRGSLFFAISLLFEGGLEFEEAITGQGSAELTLAAEKTYFEVEVTWQSDVRLKAVPHGTSFDSDENSLGGVSMWVSSTLNHPGVCSDVVDVVLYQRFGDRFTLLDHSGLGGDVVFNYPVSDAVTIQ